MQIWKTNKYGKRFCIETDEVIDLKQALNEKLNGSYYIDDKKKYAKICHIIDSNPRKWKQGRNMLLLDKDLYLFDYKGYNKYIIKAMVTGDDVEYIIGLLEVFK